MGPAEALPPSLAMPGRHPWQLGAAAAGSTAHRSSHGPIPPVNCIKHFLPPKGKHASGVFASLEEQKKRLYQNNYF